MKLVAQGATKRAEVRRGGVAFDEFGQPIGEVPYLALGILEDGEPEVRDRAVEVVNREQFPVRAVVLAAGGDAAIRRGDQNGAVQAVKDMNLVQHEGHGSIS